MLRFKTEDGSDFPDWEEKTIGDITVELREYETISSGYPVMTSSRTGLMMQDEFRSKSSTDNDTAIFSVVPRGMATYRHMSDDDIFHFNINNLVDKGLVSKEYPVFYTRNNNNLYLLVEYLNSSRKFLDFCKAQKKGGTRTRLYFKVLKDFKLNVPSFPEQQKIAEFLSTIDTVLEKQKETIIVWEEYKKGVMQKLFSREVRFKADDGSEYPDWKEKTIGEIAEIIGGGTPDTKNSEYWNGNIQWFTPSEIGTDKYVSKSKRAITEKGLNSSAAKLLPRKSVLLTSRATIGEMAISLTECCTNQGFQSLIINQDTDVEFVYYCQPIIKKYCLKHASGSTFGEISGKKVAECLIKIPCLAEQQKNVKCLSTLDDIIEKQKKYWVNGKN